MTKEPWKPNLTQLNNSTNQRAAPSYNNKSKLVNRNNGGGVENSPPQPTANTTTTTSPSCKDSFREYLLIETRGSSASIEQLAAFVSS